MSDCKTCGRDDGHYLNCEARPGHSPTAPPLAHEPDSDDPNKTPEQDFNLDGKILIGEDPDEKKSEPVAERGKEKPEPEPEAPPTGDNCAVATCGKQRWSDDKRVKYCEDHKNAKNRKE